MKVDELRLSGASLPVESVQALAAKDLKEIPERYIRPELEFDIIVSIEKSGEIPVIDLSRLLDKHFAHDELAKLNSACEEWGFFQLINHGASEEVIEKMKTDTQEFFRLPLEEKKAYAQVSNGIEGYGQAFVFSEEQKLDWGDVHSLFLLPMDQRNFKFWPTNPTSFRETTEKYSLEVHRVAVCLLGLIAKNLGIESEKFTKMFEDGMQAVRLNYYPPCPHAHKVLGLSPHSDSVALTLLTQVNDNVDGLQIKKNGNWMPVKPISGAFIVNIGDAIEIISNGKYKSIEHRAIIDSKKERLSIGAFHNQNFKTTIGPFPELVKGNITQQYKTVSFQDYLTHVASTGLDGDHIHRSLSGNEVNNFDSRGNSQKSTSTRRHK